MKNVFHVKWFYIFTLAVRQIKHYREFKVTEKERWGGTCPYPSELLLFLLQPCPLETGERKGADS